jgi:prespore-specific regulator
VRDKKLGGIELSSTRQDAWSHDEDLLLAEVVLRHIREGSTQLQAFEEVGKQMNRTAAACGFRWNSYVRKQYKSGIELAKKQRKERKGKNADQNEHALHVPLDLELKSEGHVPTLTLNDIIEFLQKLQVSQEQTVKEKETLNNEAEQLRKKYEELHHIYEDQKKEYVLLDKEYSSMLAIMEKARKMALK